MPVQPLVERCCGLVRVAGTTGADSAAILLHAAAAVQWPAEQERGLHKEEEEVELEKKQEEKEEEEGGARLVVLPQILGL